jgi:two-component system OmpR family sensor kinase
MNDLEKKSFYSFLGLYIISSLLFILLVGYWYYIAQKSALENETHYKLEHIADMTSGEIIMAHMHNTLLQPFKVPNNVKLALIDTDKKVVEGTLVYPDMKIEPGYIKHKEYNILVSGAPREHLGIQYVVVQSMMPAAQISELKILVWQMILTIFFLIIVVAWILSKIFMRPVRERVLQIERFINDVTHELNTPITSLTMSTDQALKLGECTDKTLKNISISTKQLYDIYRSLTYLNFSSKKETPEMIDLKEVLEKSIMYYSGLAQIKSIDFNIELEETSFAIPESQASLLFGNLIGNAIKYSSPKTEIDISLKNNVFTIKDRGIGIEPAQQKEIFKKFRRGTSYSGGFGIGLSIVKNICNEYGIKIEFDSVPDKGTEFRLHL